MLLVLPVQGDKLSGDELSANACISFSHGCCRATCVKVVPKVRGKQSREKVLRKLAGEADYLMRVQEGLGVVQLFETFEDAEKVYFVCELCSGGDLENVVEVCAGKRSLPASLGLHARRQHRVPGSCCKHLILLSQKPFVGLIRSSMLLLQA